MLKKKFVQKLIPVCLILSSVNLHAADSGQSVETPRYSPLKQINKANVTNLEKAWEFHTGDLPQPGTFTSFQDSPSLIDGNLVICSINRRLTAVDPATGKERWTYDHGDDQVFYRKCRGVSHWVDDTVEEGAFCRSRIFLGTPGNDLVVLDGPTGKPCNDFGDNGKIHVPADRPMANPGEMVITSSPAIVNGVVVVGSFISDNARTDAPSGRVMAYDARTGEHLWEFDPIPRDPADPAMKTWETGTDRHGAANVWTSMAVDNGLDLVYLPTTSPAVDYYGGDRPGDNLYSTSIVALRGSSGKVVWYHQLTHHNIFDYDLPSQPMLIDFPHNGKLVPALVQNTKQGLIFVFDRETGEPLVPIEERAVPQNVKVKGEVLSPTQPFPKGMPVLMPQGITPEDAWGFTFIDEWLCENKIKEFNYGPIYTPASEKGTIMVPPPGGGPNWGTGGYDPASHTMVVPSNRVPMIMTLLPQGEGSGKKEEKTAIESRAAMVFANKGAPYKTKVEALLSPLGAPCSTPPWAALTAVDMVNRKIIWEVPLGDIRKLAPVPIPWALGTPGAGAPLVTAGGLVFIGYTLDDLFRAFDLQTGEVLWEGELPAAGTAVPVTYEVNGEQYVVIPAGGHTMFGSTLGDSVVAYKLKH